MRRRLAALSVVLCLAAACSLTTSLDGFTGGSSGVAATDAGKIDGKTTGPGADAHAEPGTDSGAGGGYRAAVLADGPVGYWRLGEMTSDTNAADEVAAHAGHYVNPQGLAVGAPGATGDGNTAVSFASAGLVDIGDNFDFAGHSFSVELWVKLPATLSGYPRIISKEKFSPQNGWHFETGSAFKVSFGIHLNDNDTFTGTLPLAPEQWTHLVGTYDLATMHMYVNGTLASSKPATLMITDTVASLTLGAAPSHSDPFTGTLDEVALYDKPLSPEQVAAHYAAISR